ncbi:hypothetical protein FSP39_017537 [Pinctada imbricata]|uniref:Peptidase S1 domain-containing protein n=1 Tax=Pinctada imbricata TaxID=66713 RepID=A0AA88YF60_PINIB|nr:hypothetical protein FSP39_017537 [Pinctada imbricata]
MIIRCALLCQAIEKTGQILPDGLNIDTCTPEGGVCLRRRSPCDGYIDEHALGCPSKSVCCKQQPQAPPTEHPEPDSPDTDQCGLITRLPNRNLDPRLRVVGGDPAVEGEWPWQVSFGDVGGGHFCGGTLISNQWIISAAHCFERKVPEDVTVILGEHHQEFESGNEKFAKIDKVIMHPDYSRVHGLPNDIALVKLTSPVDISGHYVRTACTPSEVGVFNEQDICYISGWGYTQGTGDNVYLRHLQIEITSLNSCNTSWNGVITNKQICLGTGTEGACQGDSGGPLVCLRNNQYVLAGATSWGSLTCTADGFPNVYTDIMSYLPWIRGYITDLI